MRHRHYLVLSVFVVAAAVGAVFERSLPADEAAAETGRATAVLVARYPDRPLHLYYRGLAALERGDARAARRLFARAVDGRFYSNEGLLHHYARLLVEAGAPESEIDRAVGLWRKHFPRSRNPDPREYAPKRRARR